MILGLATASGALAATDPGRVTFRASSGFTTLALDRINDVIRATQQAFRSDTLVEDVRWEPFGGSPSFRVELEAQLTPVVSAGLSYHLQRGAVRHEAVRVFSLEPDTGEPAEIESFEEEPRFEAWDVVGTLGLWVPSAPGLHFGLQLGFVRGTYRTVQTHLIDTFTELPSMEIGTGEWKGSGVALGAYTGYEHAVTSDLAIATRIGYRYRRIGRLDGLLSITTWGDQGNAREWESGPLTDASGHALPMDLSGAYFDIGLTLGFGGQD